MSAPKASPAYMLGSLKQRHDRMSFFHVSPKFPFPLFLSATPRFKPRHDEGARSHEKGSQDNPIPGPCKNVGRMLGNKCERNTLGAQDEAIMADVVAGPIYPGQVLICLTRKFVPS